jgi:hypothetical protein
MADLPTATVSFLSWARQGLAARSGIAGGLAVKDGHLVLPVGLQVNNVKLTGMPVQIYGPGDIVGIDSREIVRVEPQHLMASFEPNYFPIIEFDHPDFCWMFSPAAADTTGKLQPWLCLVVVRKDSSTISVDANKPLPVLDCSQMELPDLGEAWAWAHSHVTRSSAARDLKDALAKQEHNVSRLMGPRRLDPTTAYYACVVPTFEVGLKAGLGQSFTADDEKALRPAWLSPASGANNRIQLPVYFHWEFSTGLEGDFEALARRLQPQHMPPNVGVNDVDVSTPQWGVGPFPPSAAGAVIQMEGALRNPDVNATPWADDVRVPFQTALRQILDTSAKPTSPGGSPSLVGPPLYGQWYPKLDSLPAEANPPFWFSEVNLDLRHRIAAGLGTLVVRYQQEDLMASAWDQLAAQTDNDTLKRAQLAEEVGQSLVDKHFAPLSPQRFMQVTAPIHAAVLQVVAGKSQQPPAKPAPTALEPATSLPTKASGVSLLGGPISSAAFRRISRRGGPIARRAAAVGQQAPPPTSQNTTKPTGVAGAAAPFAPTGVRATNAVAAFANAAVAFAGFAATSLPSLKSHLLGQLNPRLTNLAAVQQQSPDTQSTADLVSFAPTFTQPMYEPLRDYFADMLLPGLEHVPANSISLLETNPQFVEAYLIGLCHEFSRELLFRGFPTSRRGSYFRQFWDVRGRVPVPTPQERSQLADITPIAEWEDVSHLGDHAPAKTAAPLLVLAIRGDLLYRYPRAIICAVEALWSSSAKDAQRTLGTTELFPIFRLTRAPDITMLGFDLTEQQARGADVPTPLPSAPATPSDDAGWFFVLQEHPTDSRFGLQVATNQSFGAKPTQWSDVSWGHLAPNPSALQQIVYVPISGVLSGLTIGSATWGRNSAHMAFILRRNPFRLAVHARTWLPAQSAPSA